MRLKNKKIIGFSIYLFLTNSCESTNSSASSIQALELAQLLHKNQNTFFQNVETAFLDLKDEEERLYADLINRFQNKPKAPETPKGNAPKISPNAPPPPPMPGKSIPTATPKTSEQTNAIPKINPNAPMPPPPPLPGKSAPKPQASAKNIPTQPEQSQTASAAPAKNVNFELNYKILKRRYGINGNIFSKQEAEDFIKAAKHIKSKTEEEKEFYQEVSDWLAKNPSENEEFQGE